MNDVVVKRTQIISSTRIGGKQESELTELLAEIAGTIIGGYADVMLMALWFKKKETVLFTEEMFGFAYRLLK